MSPAFFLLLASVFETVECFCGPRKQKNRTSASGARLEPGDEALPLGADAVQQALETGFAAQRLQQRVDVGEHRVIDRAAVNPVLESVERLVALVYHSEPPCNPLRAFHVVPSVFLELPGDRAK